MFTPLGDRVLIRQDEAPDKVGSIILPEAGKERPMTGLILRAGEGRYDAASDSVVPLEVEEGDRVYFSRFAGVKIKLGEFHAQKRLEELIILREGELLGVFRPEES